MKHTQENGFTLLEMMVVVAVMGIVLAFAIPAIKTFNTSQDLKQASAGPPAHRARAPADRAAARGARARQRHLAAGPALPGGLARAGPGPDAGRRHLLRPPARRDAAGARLQRDLRAGGPLPRRHRDHE